MADSKWRASSNCQKVCSRKLSMKTDDFLSNISRSLGRESTPDLTPDPATHLALNAERVQARAQAVQRDIAARADELLTEMEVSAAQANWHVFRAQSRREAAQYIREVAQDIEARTMLRSTHTALNALNLEGEMYGTGISLEVMALDDDEEGDAREAMRADFRKKVIAADIGITGVDYAIAETGSAVLLPRKGVSRVVSLVPPVHIAVVESGQVLPSLDELFTLRRQDFLDDDLGSYMNLISGPSRSADIEYQLVTGVHGPGEVHMVLLG